MSTAEIRIDTSMVVCTCSRVSVLPRALDSLLAQTWALDHAVELIVVDDGSADGTSEYLTRLVARASLPVRVVSGPREGIAAARNAGFNAAQGGWLASFDDDQVADPDWLRRLRERAEQTRVDALGGALTLLLAQEARPRSLGPRARAVLGEHRPYPTAQPYSGAFHPATTTRYSGATCFCGVAASTPGSPREGKTRSFSAAWRPEGMPCGSSPRLGPVISPRRTGWKGTIFAGPRFVWAPRMRASICSRGAPMPCVSSCCASCSLRCATSPTCCSQTAHAAWIRSAAFGIRRVCCGRWFPFRFPLALTAAFFGR